MLRLRILTFPIISLAFCPSQPTPIEAAADFNGILCSALESTLSPAHPNLSFPQRMVGNPMVRLSIVTFLALSTAK
jgi:hypothetical protein